MQMMMTFMYTSRRHSLSLCIISSASVTVRHNQKQMWWQNIRHQRLMIGVTHTHTHTYARVSEYFTRQGCSVPNFHIISKNPLNLLAAYHAHWIDANCTTDVAMRTVSEMNIRVKMKIEQRIQFSYHTIFIRYVWLKISQIYNINWLNIFHGWL